MKRIQVAKNKKITFEVIANAISNTIIHALKVGQKPENVTILNKSPFDECTDILLNVASILPSPSNCHAKFESDEN